MATIYKWVMTSLKIAKKNEVHLTVDAEPHVEVHASAQRLIWHALVRATRVDRLRIMHCINHMLNFDENTKNELTNITQYTLLAIIPVIGLNKLMKKYIPHVDEDKGTLEIVFEIILQALILFFGLSQNYQKDSDN